MPRFLTMTYPMEFIQNEIQINQYAEWNEQTRRIFMDGRPHPDKDELGNTFYGHSIGRWDGDTLVVDTVGLRGDTNLEASGLPHSDQLRVERALGLVNDNELSLVVTLHDPKAYTQPWTVTKRFRAWSRTQCCCLTSALRTSATRWPPTAQSGSLWPSDRPSGQGDHGTKWCKVMSPLNGGIVKAGRQL